MQDTSKNGSAFADTHSRNGSHANRLETQPLKEKEALSSQQLTSILRHLKPLRLEPDAKSIADAFGMISDKQMALLNIKPQQLDALGGDVYWTDKVLDFEAPGDIVREKIHVFSRSGLKTLLKTALQESHPVLPVL